MNGKPARHVNDILFIKPLYMEHLKSYTEDSYPIDFSVVRINFCVFVRVFFCLFHVFLYSCILGVYSFDFRLNLGYLDYTFTSCGTLSVPYSLFVTCLPLVTLIHCLYHTHCLSHVYPWFP